VAINRKTGGFAGFCQRRVSGLANRFHILEAPSYDSWMHYGLFGAVCRPRLTSLNSGGSSQHSHTCCRRPQDWCLVGVIGSQDWHPPVLVELLQSPRNHWQQPMKAMFGRWDPFLTAYEVAAVLLEPSQLRSYYFISNRTAMISMIPKKKAALGSSVILLGRGSSPLFDNPSSDKEVDRRICAYHSRQEVSVRVVSLFLWFPF